jgi:hypothetical protein
MNVKHRYIFSFLMILIIGIANAGCSPAPEYQDVISENSGGHQVLFTSLPAQQTWVENATKTSEIKLTASVTTSPEPKLTRAVTPTLTPTATADLRPLPLQWRSWEIIGRVSPHAYELYKEGVENGNDPKIFSVIGDCQSIPEVFLGIYETDRYWLGENYQYLQETIDYYFGSFSRKSYAVKGGMSASTALSPLWADPEVCHNDESPVECELRIHKPSIVFINLGTNWRADASTVPYERYLRLIMDMVVKNNTLPILMTKADNVEGDFSINLITAKVAYDYDMPLLNFWLAAQSLENNGLDETLKNIYLTPDGWDRRNFVALQILDAVRKDLRKFEDE